MSALEFYQKSNLDIDTRSEIFEFTEKYAQKFAIDYANWLENLKPNEKVSVWSEDGQASGLFNMSNERLMKKYLKING